MNLSDAFLDLLYPPRCAFCHRILDRKGNGVCAFCQQKLPYTGDLSEKRGLKHISRCVSPLFYEDTVRESLHRFKFSQRSGYAGIYAGFMVKCIDENEFFCDIISWVPVSRRRKRSRGYDQSELLARAVSEKTGIPCERFLEKIRHNPPQSLTGDEKKRRENVKNVYRACQTDKMHGLRVLLIDDIVTTGATLSECARVLHEAGAAEVLALTVARTRD